MHLQAEKEQFTAGDIAVWGGIVAGTVADFAGALETGPKAVLQAMREAHVTPMVDTARQQSGRHNQQRLLAP